MAYYNCELRNFQSTLSTGHNSNNNNNNNNNNKNNNIYFYSAISISVQWCFTTTIIFLKKKSYQYNALLKNFKIKLALKFTIVLKWVKTWIKSNKNMCVLHIKDSDHKSGWQLHKWMLQGPAEFSLLPLISLSCERPLQSGKYANG